MDSWRPGADRRPSSPDYGRGDSYRPRREQRHPPRWQSSNHANNDMYHFQGSRDRSPPRQIVHRPRSGYERGRPPAGPRNDYRRGPPHLRTAANRPLFQQRQEDVNDSSLPSLNHDSRLKYRNVNDLTDSEEEKMVQSADEDEQHHTSKRPRLGENEATSAIAKWSNPDPYTSLPPAADTSVRRTDVVKLIRKARIDTDATLATSRRSGDFISLDGEDTNTQDQAADSVSSAPSTPQAPVRKQPSSLQDVPKMVTGKRKRDMKDNAEGRYGQPEDLAYAYKGVAEKWATTSGVDSTPWLRLHPRSNLAGVALHKEIIDFHEWVRPKAFEEEVRGAVFEKLAQALQSFKRGGQLRAFGSYAAGLYLPTADMDLVYLTDAYRPGWASKQQAGQLVRECASFLKQRGMTQGPVIPIAKAKVPIIKFVDRVSGLKIDLSFDNDSGLTAIDTFHQWKREYPILPIIVSIIKQYLMIRDLNDVSTGGLGGFSTICLVTSLLQHLPVTQDTPNLGDVLLEFFNYYGNVFDRKSTIIRLHPPGYLDKITQRNLFKDKDNERLTIIDPHRYDNNISGGTKNIDHIVECFSEAHKALTAKLSTYEQASGEEPVTSFLGCLIGGDFTLYERQRAQLRRLSSIRDDGARRTNGSAHSIQVDRRVERTTSPSDGAPTGQATKSQRRATRLAKLRPELAPLIRDTISVANAMKLGGYKTEQAMQRDLEIRQVARSKIDTAKASLK